MLFEFTTLKSKSGRTTYPAVTVMNHTFKFQSAKQSKLFVKNFTTDSVIESRTEAKRTLLVMDGVSYGRFSRKDLNQLQQLKIDDYSRSDQVQHQHNNQENYELNQHDCYVEISSLSNIRDSEGFITIECVDFEEVIDDVDSEISHEYIDVDSDSQSSTSIYQGYESSETGNIVLGSGYRVSFHPLGESENDRRMRDCIGEDFYRIAVGIREFQEGTRDFQRESQEGIRRLREGTRDLQEGTRDLQTRIRTTGKELGILQRRNQRRIRAMASAIEAGKNNLERLRSAQRAS